jgi:tRNA pseudouridine55 synthase
VRTLAHDLGRALGVGGHVSALRRVRVGPFAEEVAIMPDAVSEADLRPALDAVTWYPRREVSGADATAMVQGKPLESAGVEGPYAVVSGGVLVAMAEDRDGEARSICVVGGPA